MKREKRIRGRRDSVEIQKVASQSASESARTDEQQPAYSSGEGGGGVGPTHSRAQSPSPCPRLDQSRATVRTARRNHHHVLPTLSYDSSAAVAASPSPVHPRARERMREIAA